MRLLVEMRTDRTPEELSHQDKAASVPGVVAATAEPVAVAQAPVIPDPETIGQPEDRRRVRYPALRSARS